MSSLWTTPARVLPASQRSSKIRLLIVNSTLHIGGAERVAACLAEHVDLGHFEVSACYLKEPGVVADQMLAAGVDLIPIPGLVEAQRDYLSFRKLWRLIYARGIQVLHTHDLHGFIDATICRAISPRLRHVHTFHFGNYPHRERRYIAIERLLWRIPDALIAVGYVQAASIRALYSIPSSRIRVIWNGVEPSQPQPEEPLLATIRRQGEPVIASISTLIPQKGMTYLLDAVALLRESGERFQLVIAGDGHLKESLIEYARRRDLTDCVHFLGWIPHASDRLLPHCDIFVQSSLWEAMSVVVLEAMAAAKPMVVTQVGENATVIVNGETGILVPPADTAALADGLRTLLHSSELREQFGKRARTLYEERFSVRRMVQAYENLYRELIEE